MGLRVLGALVIALAIGGVTHTSVSWAAPSPLAAATPSPSPGPSTPGPPASASPTPSASPSVTTSTTPTTPSAPAPPQPAPTDICRLVPSPCPVPSKPPLPICSINPDLCDPPAQSPNPPGQNDEDDGEDDESKFTWCEIPPVDSVCVLKNIWQFSEGAYNDTSKAVDFTKDPFGYMSQALMSGFAWLLGELGQLINKTTQVDWTNPAFLRTYAQMFGLATVVTVFLWLLAVVKRVVAGIPPLVAAGESIGYLLLSVVVTVFMPAAVYSVDQIFELASGAVFSSVPQDLKAITQTVVKAWAVMSALGGGGVFMTMIGSFLLFAVVSVWVELTVRSAMIYLSLAFGPLVFSGLVDKALWNHTKKWIGFTLAILSSKLVTLTVLSLATGMLASINSWSTDAKDPLKAISIVLTVLALLFLAFLAPVVISRFIPAFGDEIAMIAQARQDTHGTTRQARDSDRMQALADGIEHRNDQVSGWKDKVDSFDQRNGKGSPPADAAKTGQATGRPGGAAGGAAGGDTAGGAAGGGAAGGAGPATAVVAGAAAKGKETADRAAQSGVARATGGEVPAGGDDDAGGGRLGGTGTGMAPPLAPTPDDPAAKSGGNPPSGAPDLPSEPPPASPPPEPPSDGEDTPRR